MKIIECQQGTPEWFEARRGIPSASNFHKILTAKTGKLSAAADDYAIQLIAERIRFDPPYMAGPANAAMRHGIECEPEARSYYEFQKSVTVREVGFCVSDCGRFGCSPDGLVDDDGGLELKCVQPATQVAYLLDGGLPAEYRTQVHGELIVTGRQWWDFLSYCVGFPPLLVRVVPDDYTKLLADALEHFANRLAQLAGELNAKVGVIEPRPAIGTYERTWNGVPF